MLVLVMGASCSPPVSPPVPEGGGANPYLVQPLDPDSVARAGYLAAGLEAASYILSAHSRRVGSKSPQSGEASEGEGEASGLRARAVTLLAMADEVITTTLAASLRADQELPLTASWNAWRRAQLQMLHFDDPDRDVASDGTADGEAVFESFMQIVWGEARAPVLAAYLREMTEDLDRMLSSICSGDAEASGQAMASLVAWHERFAQYLYETSLAHGGGGTASVGGPADGVDAASGNQDRAGPGPFGIGWSRERRLAASSVAAGMAAAALTVPFRRGADQAPDPGYAAPITQPPGCSAPPSPVEFYDSALRWAANSLRVAHSENAPVEREVRAALVSLSSDESPDSGDLPQAVAGVEGALAGIARGEGVAAAEVLERVTGALP